MRWSMAARNAASVFPEPVGARTSTLSPFAIAGQASSCARVGAWNVASNHARVPGLKLASGLLPTATMLRARHRARIVLRTTKGARDAGPFQCAALSYADLTEACTCRCRHPRTPRNGNQHDWMILPLLRLTR